MIVSVYFDSCSDVSVVSGADAAVDVGHPAFKFRS